MGTESASRITCPHCGEQNYETDLVCWACNAALRAPAQLPVETQPELLPGVVPDGYPEPLVEPFHVQTETPLDGLSRAALAAASLLVPGAGLLAGILLLTVRQSAQNRHFGIVCLGLAIIPPVIWLVVSLMFVMPLLSKLIPQMTGPGGPLGGGLVPTAWPWLYNFGRWLTRAILTVFGRWEVEGRENIPETGGVILAPNHISYLDPPAAGAAIERPTWFMAKEPLFRIPILGRIIPRTRAFPVRRGTADRRALRMAMDLLSSGEVVVVFPEGMRSQDGKLGEPELGFALIALKTRAPVVPMALIGTTSVLPYDSPFIRPGKVHIRIGEPMTFPDLYDGPGKKPDLEEVGRRVMGALGRLQDSQ